MKITIESRINVDGTWWDLATDHIVPSSENSKEKVEGIKKVIRGLTSAGMISRVAVKVALIPKPGGVPQAQFVQEEDVFRDDEMPTPHCALHREAMSISKVQKKEGHTVFYCRLKTEDGEYCKNRATVLDETGAPKFWSVK